MKPEDFDEALEWFGKFERGECDSSQMMAMTQTEIRTALRIAKAVCGEPTEKERRNE